MNVARVVAGMYRIDNVIFLRIKAIVDQRALDCPTAQLLCYRPKARPAARTKADEVKLAPIDPQAPVHG
jgi:hypothetical protein